MMIRIRIVATRISRFSLVLDRGKSALLLLIMQYMSKLNNIIIAKGIKLSKIEVIVETLKDENYY